MPEDGGKKGGGPGGIRTLGPSVKSRLLYLAELRAPRVWRETWLSYISFSEDGDVHSPALALMALMATGRTDMREAPT